MRADPSIDSNPPRGRWLLFSDIHASRVAAREIERLAGGFDHLVCAGDICGYGDDPEYVIDLFIALGVAAVRGNHDHMVLDETIDLRVYPDRVSVPIERARAGLRGRHRDYLAALPWEIDFADDGLFVRHTVGIQAYCRQAGDCDPLIRSTRAPLIVFGHTHVPCSWRRDGRQLVNPGSIAHGRRGTPRSYATWIDGTLRHHNLGGPA